MFAYTHSFFSTKIGFRRWFCLVLLFAEGWLAGWLFLNIYCFYSLLSQLCTKYRKGVNHALNIID